MLHVHSCTDYDGTLASATVPSVKLTTFHVLKYSTHLFIYICLVTIPITDGHCGHYPHVLQAPASPPPSASPAAGPGEAEVSLGSAGGWRLQGEVARLEPGNRQRGEAGGSPHPAGQRAGPRGLGHR